eukprot:CAMPEP_0176356300 /NCGR_PEP_ID=MMETSP0126-20121128/13916_1 /TAXON_ID=141414 ORGANISM="Strombidinopsis acuminatum, Strain SPMC142" /NCGR_SAMPLE_ID=MMETSP0126 /ASSEMBLY_ACC=CAM_ASM_000229 /LENGTH=91 /DNA_ID=CAMNT_0017709331 /DNA_START=27 /DNA_END=302 /DNA_ORIENTATION=+
MEHGVVSDSHGQNSDHVVAGNIMSDNGVKNHGLFDGGNHNVGTVVTENKKHVTQRIPELADMINKHVGFDGFTHMVNNFFLYISKDLSFKG